MSKRIFVADDDTAIRELVAEYLRREGYDVEVFDNGDSILEAFTIKRPDMLVIDIMMPGADGLTVCQRIRAQSDVPIIIISAKDDETDRIIGLELGGDDYISKPFSPRELVIRVGKIFDRLLRGTMSDEKNLIRIGDLIISLDGRQARHKDNVIDFTGKELDLLIELCQSKDRVYTREALIRKIWGYDFIGETRSIDDLVKRIRKKLNNAGSKVRIETVWGYGYKATDGDL